MDLQKHVSARDARLRKFFELYNRLESTLDFDDNNAEASFESQSMTSKLECENLLLNANDKADDNVSLPLDINVPAKKYHISVSTSSPFNAVKDVDLTPAKMMLHRKRQESQTANDSLVHDTTNDVLNIQENSTFEQPSLTVPPSKVQSPENASGTKELAMVSERSTEPLESMKRQDDEKNDQVKKSTDQQAPEQQEQQICSSKDQDPKSNDQKSPKETNSFKTDDDLAQKSIGGKHARFLTEKSSDLLISNQSAVMMRHSSQKQDSLIKKRTYEDKKQRTKKALTISQNEQELLQEIRERMQEYMKEEEQQYAGKKGKGFFDKMMEEYQQQPVAAEVYSPPRKYDGPPSKELVSKRGRSETKDKLSLYLDKPFKSEKPSYVATADSQPYEQKDKTQAKDENMLRALFTERILEIMAQSKEDMLDRPRSVKVDKPEHREMLKEAIESTLRELGPSFGLKSCIIPQQTDKERSYSSANSYFPLTGELKTEIMHSAVYILREQAQSGDDIGIKKLENVINMQHGAMRNILQAGKFSRRRVRNCCSFDEHVEREQEELEMQQRRSVSQNHDDFSSFVQNAQKAGAMQFFQSLTKKNIKTQKLILRRKVDELEDQQQKKLDKLKHLYMELEQVTNNNVFQEVSRIQVDERAAQRKPLENAQNKDPILDNLQPDRFFNFTDLESCMERKRILESKYGIVQKRLEEALNQNTILKAMVKTNKNQNNQQQKATRVMKDKEDDINNVIAQVEAINHIEGSRQYQMNSVHFDIRRKLQADQEVMESIAEEKEQELKYEQEETQQVLYNLLNHTRRIKKFNNSIKRLEQQKVDVLEEQQIVLKKFEGKQEEIRLLKVFWQLNMIMKYNSEIELVANGQDEELSVDKLRLRGLKCVDTLKKNILDIKSEERFDLIQTMNQIEKARNLRKRIEIKMQNKHLMCSGSKLRRNKTSQRVALSRSSTSKNHEQSAPKLLSVHMQPAVSRKLVKAESLSPNSVQHRSIEKQQSSSHRGTRFTEVSESASCISYEFKESEQSHDADMANVHLDTYIKDRESYDNFYQGLLFAVDDLQEREIMDIYLLSSIKNSQLRNAFKQEEGQKAALAQERDRLQDQLNYYQNESKIIGEFIRQKSIDQAMHINQISEYPISAEGMQIYLEELAVRKKGVNDRKAKFGDKVLQLQSGFIHCIQQAVQRLNAMHNAALDKIDFEDRELQIVAKLNDRYLHECKHGEKESTLRGKKFFKRPNNFQKQKTIRAQNKGLGKRSQGTNASASGQSFSKLSRLKDKHSISSIAEHDLDKEDKESLESCNSSTISLSHFKSTSQAADKNPLNSIMNLVNLAKTRTSQSTERTLDQTVKEQVVMNKKTQERRLFRDVVALLSILSNSGNKLNVAEKFARRLQFFGSSKKKRNSSMQQGSGGAFKVQLSDFDPVFRKQEFPKVKQGVLTMLNLDQRQLAGSMRSLTISNLAMTKKNTRARLKIKKSADPSLDNKSCPDQEEYEKMAQDEKKRQREIQRKQQEHAEKLAQKANERDNSHSSQEDKQQAAYLKRLEEHQQKMQRYVDQHQKKREYLQDKSFLYRNKRIIQKVEKSEQFFIKDLKEKINARYQTLKEDFAKRYELKKGSYIVHGNEDRQTLNESMIDKSSIGVDTKSSQKVLTDMQKRQTRQTRQTNSQGLQPRKNEHICMLRKSLLAPNVEQRQMSTYTFQEDIDGRPNLSQQQRTRKLYQSLVDTAANIKQVEESNFRDPRASLIMKRLDHITESPQKHKPPSNFNSSEQFENFATQSKSYDFRKMQQVLSQQFSELRPTQDSLDAFLQNGMSSKMIEKPTSLANILKSTQDQMRPVTSPCFDMKDKQAFHGSSLKDRIRINNELTKSVKLHQRKSHTNRQGHLIYKTSVTSPQFLSNSQFLNNHSSKFKNNNHDLAENHFSGGIVGGTATFTGQHHAASQLNMPMNIRSQSIAGPGFQPQSENSSKVSINIFSAQAMGKRNGANKFNSINASNRRSQQVYRGPQYTTNRAFNNTYQTVQLQKALKHA